MKEYKYVKCMCMWIYANFSFGKLLCWIDYCIKLTLWMNLEEYVQKFWLNPTRSEAIGEIWDPSLSCLLKNSRNFEHNFSYAKHRTLKKFWLWQDKWIYVIIRLFVSLISIEILLHFNLDCIRRWNWNFCSNSSNKILYYSKFILKPIFFGKSSVHRANNFL